MINAKYIMTDYENYYFKQITWFILGFILIIAISNFKSKYFFKLSSIFYLINVILLILVLFFGKEINNTKAWFDLKYLSYQPSETMKLALILFLSSIVSNTEIKKLKDEFILIIKVLIITLIPAILTFLEPDTGAVIIYIVIALIILFASTIKLRWFVIGLIIILLGLGSFIYLYLNYQDIFINIFGTSFFYRMDRILEIGNGLQIENALTAIGSSGIFGTGIKTVAIYFPEAPTDFVFALTISNFGYLGGLIVILTFIFFFIVLLLQIKKQNKKENKLFIIAFLAMFIFQVAQNILMNLGITPIIGITLPFISYGGTSTLLYFLCIAIIISMMLEKKKISN